MEGFVLDKNILKRTGDSYEQDSPNKKTFVGISPLKEFTNITTPSDRPFRVSVEGNIGAGKSSLIEYFSKFPGIETYPVRIQWFFFIPCFILILRSPSTGGGIWMATICWTCFIQI